MSENNSNIFFDDVTHEVDPTPVDLSSLTKAEIIPDSCVLMRLEISAAGFQKQFAPSEVIDEEGIDNTLVNTSKRLLDKKYLDPISKLDSRMRTDMYQIGMRPKFLGTGNVIIPLRLLHYTIRRLEEYQATREQLINNLLEQYEDAKEETKLRSPDLYREEEYPGAEELRSKFTVAYNIFSVAFPDVLDRIEAGVVTEMGVKVEAALQKQAKAQEQQLEDAVDELRAGLRTGFYELVDNLEDKVRGVGTERKVFKPGFVSAFRTFLETFDAKNITNDVELAEMVKRCRAVMAGVSPDAIRNNLDIKVKLENELGSIKTGLAALVEPIQRRASFK